MMNNISVALILMLMVCGCTNRTPETRINLDTVDLFLSVADSVSRGEDVSTATWDSLVNSDGYVMVGWHKRNGLIQNATLIAFHPDSATVRDSLLQGNIPMSDPRFHTSLIVRNYIDMLQHWAELRNFRSSYDYVSIEKQAREIFKNFMPNAVDSLINFPNIGFICGDPECRSMSSGISLDFNYFYKRPQEGIKILAHEMFHSYRENFEDWDRFKNTPGLIVINFIQNEGIADLIDKPVDYDAVADFKSMGYPAVIGELYNDAVSATSEKMALVDSLTVSFAHGEMSRDEYREQTEVIFPLGGHPNGRYLTNLIVSHGYRERLLANFANPTEFVVLYNKIAEAEGLHVMSQEFMQIVGAENQD